MKREKESFAGRLNKYKVSLKNRETKLEVEQLKNIALVIKLKMMEQVGKILRVDKDLPRKSTFEMISNSSVERQTGLNFTDRVISSVQIELVRLAM